MGWEESDQLRAAAATEEVATAARLVLLRADIDSVLGDIVIGREKATLVSDAQSWVSQALLERQHRCLRRAHDYDGRHALWCTWLSLDTAFIRRRGESG